jgi:replicative DNA helicase
LSETEYVGLIIEDELLDHLAVPESVIALRKEKFSVDWINENEKDIRRVFLFALAHLKDHGDPADQSILEYEFGAEFKPPQAPIRYVIDQFRKRYQRREAQKTIKTVSRLVAPSPIEAVNVAFREFSRLRKETMERRFEIDSDEIDVVIDRYKQRIQARTDVPTFGYPKVDEDLNGIIGLVFIIARPKRYKSWQLVNAAVWNQYCGNVVSFETLEMPKEEILDRYACQRAEISWSKFQHGALSVEDLDKLREVKEYNENNDVKVHFHHPKLGERTVAHMQMRAEEIGADVILVDQLKWIECEKKVGNDQRWREVEYICEDLKEMSNVIPTYVAAQFNRQAANLGEMADLSQIGLSDAIGQTADLLLGIYANKEMLQNGLLQFGVIDSRNFEQVRYEMKVDLSKNSSFRILNRVEEW